MELDHPLLNKALCAHTECTFRHSQTANKACARCFLVLYCSKDCQIAHWSLHKLDCRSPLIESTWRPSWQTEGRRPSFMSHASRPIITPFGCKRKYLWGNMPALDVLNLRHNEGRDIAHDLRLLFAASGDIRNVITTIGALPETYPGQCRVVVNDRDFDIVARNAILLLTAFHLPPEVATPILIHIWYSCLIPARMLQTLQRDILPLIEDVCAKIASKTPHKLLSKTWSYRNSSLRLIFEKKQWDQLRNYFHVPAGVSAEEAQRSRRAVMMAPEREDHFHRALYAQPPPWRPCSLKFRQDGILLPFGSPREEFDTPNPTLYHEENGWPMPDAADPCRGWDLREIMTKPSAAKHDLYGNLFAYVQNQVSQFCQRIARLQVHIRLFHLEAVQLPAYIQQLNEAESLFDRIEVSNIADRAYLGTQTTLATFGPLLKPKAHNPKATLLLLFLNAVDEMCSLADEIASLEDDRTRMRRYLPMHRPSGLYDADALRFMHARSLFRDGEAFFRRYMDRGGFHDARETSGVQMRETHRITAAWPMRPGSETTQSEFEILEASGVSGCERYVEWERAS